MCLSWVGVEKSRRREPQYQKFEPMWLRLLVGKHEVPGALIRNNQMAMGGWSVAGMATMNSDEHLTKHKVADWPSKWSLVWSDSSQSHSW